MKEKTKNIMWISGGSGYGKTNLAKHIIQYFKAQNIRGLMLSGEDLVNFLIKQIRTRRSIDGVVHRFQNYGVLVLDNIGYTLMEKPFAQTEVKEIVKKIAKNNTMVILITQVRAEEMKKLKFDSNECFYLRLKSPTSDFKRKLVEKWLKNIQNVPREEKEEIINKAANLFQLKGLCNQICFKHNNL